MALFTPQNAQTTVDLPTHIHDTFIREVLQANISKKAWGFLNEGRPLQHQTGANVSVPLEAALPVDTTVLAEDTDGLPLVSADSAVLIPCPRYGHYLLITADAVEQKDMNTIDAKTKALAEQAVKKQDLIAGTAAVAGTNIVFKNGRVDANALLAGDVVDATDFVSARSFLDSNDAMSFADGLFRCVLPPASIADLFSDDAIAKGFLQQIIYADPSALIAGEVGTWHGFRVFQSSQVSISTLGAATATADLILCVFSGAEYLGFAQRTPITFSGFKPAGDIMEQQFKMLWKGRFGYGRVKEGNARRLEARSAFSPNP